MDSVNLNLLISYRFDSLYGEIERGHKGAKANPEADVNRLWGLAGEQYFDRTLLCTRVFLLQYGSRWCHSIVLSKNVAGSLLMGPMIVIPSRAKTVDQRGWVTPSDPVSSCPKYPPMGIQG